MADVSQKPATNDRHKSPGPEQWEKLGIARITEDAPFIGCSCGWTAQHRRDRIRGDKAERHVNKRHGGQAMWF